MSTDVQWARACRAALELVQGVAPQTSVSPTLILRVARYHGLVAEVHSAARALGLQEVAAVTAQPTSQLVLQSMARYAASLKILGLLRDAGIQAVGMKGIGLAAQTRAIPMGRPSVDVDLLISPTDVLTAHDVLSTGGGVLGERYPVPAPTLAYSLITRMRQEAGYQICGQTLDLHWQLGLARRVLAPTHVALSRAVEVPVAGTDWPTLSVPDALVHSAIHWRAAGYGRLKYVLDIEALRVQLSPEELNRLPKSVRDVMAVSHGLVTASPTWAPTIDVPVLQWRAAIGALAPAKPRSSFRARANGLFTQFTNTPGVRDRAMIPVRAAVGPVVRRYERVVG